VLVLTLAAGLAYGVLPTLRRPKLKPKMKTPKKFSFGNLRPKIKKKKTKVGA
jgi:hypothetical protein